MEGDSLTDIQRDFLQGIATCIDAFNRLVDLYAPERTTLRPIAMQVRAEIVEESHGGTDSTRSGGA